MTRHCRRCVINWIWRAFALNLLALSMSAFADPGARTLEIFTNRNFPVTGIETAKDAGWIIKVYDLDTPKQMVQALGEGLPGNLKRAKTVVLDRVDRIGKDEIKRRFQAAYQGHFKAFEYQIKKYPALVFNRGKAVLYGMPDVERALEQYQTWKNRVYD